MNTSNNCTTERNMLPKKSELHELEEGVVLGWEIANFFPISEESNKFHYSPEFYFSGASWSLRIYPNGQTSGKSKGFVSLYAIKTCCGVPVHLKASFKIMISTMQIGPISNFDYVFVKKYSGWGVRTSTSRLDLMEYKNQFTDTNTLTVFCRLETTTPKNVNDTLFRRLKDVSNNLRNIYEKRKSPDVIVKIDEEHTMHAHSVILRTRSPFFAPKFNEETNIDCVPEVRIKDIDKSTMNSILLYIYSGDTDIITMGNVLSLYCASIKCGIKNIKKMCVQFLIKNLTVDIVLNLIEFAAAWKDEELYQRTREFFRDNAREILHSQNWKIFVERNHYMSIEILSTSLISLLPLN